MMQDVEHGHYPGLVNISGTYCFMNSVLQVSLSESHTFPPTGLPGYRLLPLSIISSHM